MNYTYEYSGTRLTGGVRGYVAAMRDAYGLRVHNPAIRYRHGYGWFAESGMITRDGLDYDQQVFYRPNGDRSHRRCDYADIRRQIIEKIIERRNER